MASAVSDDPGGVCAYAPRAAADCGIRSASSAAEMISPPAIEFFIRTSPHPIWTRGGTDRPVLGSPWIGAVRTIHPRLVACPHAFTRGGGGCVVRLRPSTHLLSTLGPGTPELARGWLSLS